MVAAHRVPGETAQSLLGRLKKETEGKGRGWPPGLFGQVPGVKSQVEQSFPVGGLSVGLESHHTMADNIACTGVSVLCFSECGTEDSSQAFICL